MIVGVCCGRDPVQFIGTMKNREVDVGPESTKIAVIIPYFQRKPGLLRQCVKSVLANAGNTDVKIIVVDDASPVTAENEITDIVAEGGDIVSVIHQGNAGPAAARNNGLEHVAAKTDFVAFLDSDDQWTGPFLPDAVWALGQGYDLFIGNTRRGGGPSRFSWDSDPGRNIDAQAHTLIDPGREIYEFRGDFFDLMVQRSNIVSATAMAYRLDRFRSLRFPESLYQGEDRVFKLRLAQELDQVAFSPKIYAEEGEGVNVLDKSGWKTEGYLRLTSNYIAMSRRILEEIELNSQQRAFVRRQLDDSRRAFAAAILHQLRHRKPLDWARVRSTLSQDPKGAMLLFPNLFRIVGQHLIDRTKG